ncbi:MAG: MFS transporter [Candidatus Altiarchaeales archaeon ex4484_96]|nr:MAG: MFS transporter [Candidatus Altiarchaeales archaeon ex4484_96]
MAEKAGNRWLVMIGALMLQLCLGAVYAWSVFAAELKADFAWSVTETQIVFSVALATFALVMVWAGKLQDKMGPQKIALVGAGLLGLSYVASGFMTGNFMWFLLTLGIGAGAGIGLAYVCPIAALGKWFPDKLGLATGLAVAGFGGGAFFISVLSGKGINMIGIQIDLIQLLAKYGLGGTLQIWGIMFLAVGGVGAFLLSNPPAGWKPEGWVPPAPSAKTATSEDWERGAMIKTPQFWMLLVMFVFAASAGLMTIGILKVYGIDSGLAAAAAGTAVGILSIFNGAGRIVWGWLSDKLGRPMAMALMFFLQALMMFALIFLGLGSNTTGLAVAAAWIGFMFGGNFALFPAATRDFFGIKNYGGNYAMVFLGYGVAGIIGPILAGQAKDILGSYDMAFIISGVMCVIAAVLAFLTKAPHHNE